MSGEKLAIYRLKALIPENDPSWDDDIRFRGDVIVRAFGPEDALAVAEIGMGETQRFRDPVFYAVHEIFFGDSFQSGGARGVIVAFPARGL